jgi:hypothetical protein
VASVIVGVAAILVGFALRRIQRRVTLDPADGELVLCLSLMRVPLQKRSFRTGEFDSVLLPWNGPRSRTEERLMQRSSFSVHLKRKGIAELIEIAEYPNRSESRALARNLSTACGLRVVPPLD